MAINKKYHILYYKKYYEKWDVCNYKKKCSGRETYKDDRYLKIDYYSFIFIFIIL